MYQRPKSPKDTLTLNLPTVIIFQEMRKLCLSDTFSRIDVNVCMNDVGNFYPDPGLKKVKPLGAVNHIINVKVWVSVCDLFTQKWLHQLRWNLTWITHRLLFILIFSRNRNFRGWIRRPRLTFYNVYLD